MTIRVSTGDYKSHPLLTIRVTRRWLLEPSTGDYKSHPLLTIRVTRQWLLEPSTADYKSHPSVTIGHRRSLMYQSVERPNLLGLSCRLRLECGMTFLHCVWYRNAGWVQGCSQPLVAWGVFSSFFRCAGACRVAKAIYKQLCLSNLGLYCWF